MLQQCHLHQAMYFLGTSGNLSWKGKMFLYVLYFYVTVWGDNKQKHYQDQFRMGTPKDSLRVLLLYMYIEETLMTAKLYWETGR